MTAAPISRFPVPDPATLPDDMRQLIMRNGSAIEIAQYALETIPTSKPIPAASCTPRTSSA